MTSTLLDIPFDHYQRYAAAAHLLQALALDAPRVLEVGANRQRLLGQFLPQATFLYTDLHAEGDETDFVVADATALPFADQQFDAVVSLDVLEHIPAALRTRAIAEMARVAGRAVIVGFPPQRPWVERAELDANGRWHELFGEDYVWLQEHKEFGLVQTEDVVQTFEAAGMEVLRFGQGNADLWAGLMGAHFIKVKFPELEPLVQAADRLYNSRVFAGDHSDAPYREYYVAVRSDADAARLRADPPFQAGSDAEATALLTGLAGGLRALALRAHNAEREWESTARMLDAYIADLAVAKREWGTTAEYVHQLQAAKDQGDADWLSREAAGQAALQQVQAALQQRSAEIDELGQVVAQRDDQLIQADARLQDEREQQARARQDLQHKLQEDAEAYARSRRKWKLAMLALAVGGLVAGYLVAWATS
ncbi:MULTISPECIES: class I SAM-dependent methyltransferase [Stenotrophomonas]|uniref:Methyltransferase domain-containing protein n=1 Tax=Stenotrophomonas lactitubi TaxID=2045214 RepID=A0AAW4GMR8_9GAMM|nr:MULTISPECIES: methyltransferase domain-containing protein [Stenotrophomonas]MBM9915603.1 methyltransferase domain-containing protein [Stenotrophomonas lactitubi]MBM9922719.1 methyltransferase domain-containing protein [Stenotrophomonas lactitubi]MBM9939349.1 methyltransferase domain-containing protein [Stenotrophomonas lactitubi]